MYRQRIRHLPVVAADESLKGIVTDRDLRHHLFRPGVFDEIGDVPVESLLRATLVETVMSTPVLQVTPEENVEVAARLMAEHKVGALPVVDQGRVVGVLTESDLLSMNRWDQPPALEPADDLTAIAALRTFRGRE